MSPPLGRVQAALARREGRAPGVARDGARRVVRKGGRDRRRRSGAPRAQRARQGADCGLQWPTARPLRMLRALAIAAGIVPGGEYEGGRGRRLRGKERVRIEDDEAAIEELAKFHSTAGVGAAPGPGRDLEPAGAQSHGVVPGHDARVAAAQDAIEIARRWPPRGRGGGRRAPEAPDEVGEELGQKRVALLEGMERAQAQFADEAVLERAPEAFDAA